jgi:16S rRNA C967 or C1407 C5-methylase (RsmB/RsmF family)
MEFKEHLKKYLNEEDINSLTDSFDKKEHKGLILNPSKMSDEKFIKLFPNVKKHPIVPHAYLYDQDEYEMGKSIYHDLGSFYIQDPSASLVSYFLMPKECEQVLDMCAAPGGKSVQASMLMNQKGILYSNDLSFKRAEILLSNV